MMLLFAIDEVAKTIHESRYGEGTWAKVPLSATNPSRYYARKAAIAVFELMGAEPGIVSETFGIAMEDGKNAITDALAASQKAHDDEIAAKAAAKAKEKKELQDAAGVLSSELAGDDEEDDE